MPKKAEKPYVYLRKDGRYEGRYKKQLSSDKKEFKQISVYGSTYEEAMEKALKGLASNSNRLTIEKEPVFIKDLIDPWLLETKKTMKPSTYALYQRYAEKYLFKSIGDRNAVSFDENALIALLQSFQTEKGLSKSTIYILEEMIRSLFRYGISHKLIPKVSFGKVKYQIPKKKEVLPLSELEVKQLLHILEQQEMDIQIQVLLPLYAGVSLSELCGLRWEDIDFCKGTIYVHRNLKRIPKTEAEKKQNGKATTMVAEYELLEEECREFLIPEKLYQLLKRAEEIIKPMKNRYVAVLNINRDRTDLEKDFNENIGITPVDGRTLQYRLKIIGEQAGILNLTFRVLRDTFAVMCLQAGGDAYSLAYVLGITVSAVCDRYQPWMVRKDGFLKEIG